MLRLLGLKEWKLEASVNICKHELHSPQSLSVLITVHCTQLFPVIIVSSLLNTLSVLVFVTKSLFYVTTLLMSVSGWFLFVSCVLDCLVGFFLPLPGFVVSCYCSWIYCFLCVYCERKSRSQQDPAVCFLFSLPQPPSGREYNFLRLTGWSDFTDFILSSSNLVSTFG